jgi:hypothetical protein
MKFSGMHERGVAATMKSRCFMLAGHAACACMCVDTGNAFGRLLSECGVLEPCLLTALCVCKQQACQSTKQQLSGQHQSGCMQVVCRRVMSQQQLLAEQPACRAVLRCAVYTEKQGVVLAHTIYCFVHCAHGRARVPVACAVSSTSLGDMISLAQCANQPATHAAKAKRWVCGRCQCGLCLLCRVWTVHGGDHLFMA